MGPTRRAIRSLLFVPANRPDWIKKAIRSGTDAVIIDIEDSVPKAEKQRTRGLLQSEAAELAEHNTAAILRTNALEEGCAEDLAFGVTPDLFGVILPKVSNAEEIRELDRLLSYHEGRLGIPLGQIVIYPLTETAEGLSDAKLIARASTRVHGLFGGVSGSVSGDLARAFGYRPTMAGLEQLYLNSKLVLESRAAGAMHPIASVIGSEIADLVSTEKLIVRLKEIGYSAAVLIHPSHVPIANKVFRPTADEISYFEGMLTAFDEAEKAGSAAVRYKDKMIDYAMLPLAREIVQEAESLRRRGIQF